MRHLDAVAFLSQYDLPARTSLLEIRTLIHQISKETEDIGEIEEALKWGQLSFLTVRPKTGTTVRIDADKVGDVALFVNCQTSLVSEWRGMFPELTFGGTRSVHFPVGSPLPIEPLSQMLLMALTYHSRKKGPGSSL